MQVLYLVGIYKIRKGDHVVLQLLPVQVLVPLRATVASQQ